MKKEWMNPDLCDLTIRATANGGSSNDEFSPSEFHCGSSNEGDGYFGGNNKPGHGGSTGNGGSTGKGEYWGGSCGW